MLARGCGTQDPVRILRKLVADSRSHLSCLWGLAKSCSGRIHRPQWLTFKGKISGWTSKVLGSGKQLPCVRDNTSMSQSSCKDASDFLGTQAVLNPFRVSKLHGPFGTPSIGAPSSHLASCTLQTRKWVQIPQKRHQSRPPSWGYLVRSPSHNQTRY